MYILFLVPSLITVPASFRTTVWIWPLSAHVFDVASYTLVSPLPLGHCPHEARTMDGGMGPPARANAADSSHASGRSATAASFQPMVPGFQASTVTCANSVPTLFSSPPMA